MDTSDKENTAYADPLATAEIDVALMPESNTFQNDKKQHIRGIFGWIVWLVFLMTATHFIESSFLQTLAVIATTLHAWLGCRWLLNTETALQTNDTVS